METLDLLEAVLDDYEGTLILVSHDRDFLDRLVTAVIAMEGDGRTIEVAGGYSDYRRYKQDQGESATRARAADDKVRSKVEAPRPKKTTKLGYKDRSEEHTSELQSLMRISYAVFCLKKKQRTIQTNLKCHRKH